MVTASHPGRKYIRSVCLQTYGSTTAALVHFKHQVTKMLEQNNYIRCLMIDFTKAFDTVNHIILLSKLIQLSK